MRRLHTRRAGARAEDAMEGLPRMILEGDAADAPADEAATMLPFAGTLASLTARAPEFERLGRRLDAIGVLRERVGRHPEDLEARLRLAHLLETGGEGDVALDLLQEGFGPTGGHPALRALRGALLSRLGRHTEAEADVRAALAADASHPEALLQLGVILLRLGRHAEAIPPLRRAVERDPGGADAALHLGEAHYYAGEFAAAETRLRRAAELHPNDPRAWKLLGRLLDRLGRTDEALAMHRRAREAGTV